MSARGVRPAGAALAAIVVLGGAVGSATAAERALVARTGRARGITDSSAILAGTVRGGESVRYRFVFGTTRFYGQRTRWAVGRSGHGPVLVSAPLGSLRPATTYHYRLLARACSGCRAVSGADRAFTTAPLPGAAAPPTAPGASSPSPAAVPTAMTGASRAAGKTSATLAGEVNPERTTTSYYFAYGPTVAYGSQSLTQQAGAGDTAIAVAADVGGLGAATTYHYRLVARTSAGTAYGADETFTTEGYYQNPLYSTAFPDPFVLDDGNRHSDYWTFGTGDLFGVLHSTDLVHWTPEGTALSSRPAWAVSSGDWHPWAPSVAQSDQACPGSTSGRCYVMYHVGLSAKFAVNCVGVATSPTPGGPYTEQGPLTVPGAPTGSSAMPIGCGDAAGKGNIDPSPFVDSSGHAYLYVTTDQSCSGGSCVLAPTISVIPLTSDMLNAAGPRIALLPGDPGSWEASGVAAPTVEGPSMELHDGTYYLFYSGGSWRRAYGMGYATASSPTGPFTKSAANPVLAETGSVLGPGGGDVFVTGPHGGVWVAYAARSFSYAEPRTLRLDPVSWRPASAAREPDIPVIEGPTASPEATQP